MYVLNHIHVGPTFGIDGENPNILLHTRSEGVYSFSGSGGTPPKKPKAPVKKPGKKPKK